MIKDVRYLKFRGEVIDLYKDSSGFWIDKDGAIYALADVSPVDTIDRCGVGVFSLGKNSPLNRLCKKHDYMYQSPVYQYYYTREEADKALMNDFRLANRPLIGRIFYSLARLFGAKYWENKKTNN